MMLSNQIHVATPQYFGALSTMEFLPPYLSDYAYPGFPGDTITADVNPHTPGAWFELTASLSEDAAGMLFSYNANISASATDTSTIVEIGVGPASSEVVHASFIVSGITLGLTNPGAAFMFVPGFIAAGTRVSVRCRSLRPSKTVQFQSIYFIPVQGDTPPAPTTIGINTATSRGATLGLANVWTEIVAATDVDLDYLSVFIGYSSAVGVAADDNIDIGIGEVGLETPIISDIIITTSTSETLAVRTPLMLPFKVAIPAGTRIVARHTRNEDTMTDVSLVGV